MSFDGMWITDLQTAMQELFDIYGFWSTVARIENNIIVMSDGSQWIMDGNGHISRFEEGDF